MNLTDALTELRSVNQPVPKPPRLPTEEEVDQAEKEIGFGFPADFRRFLLEASDIIYGTKEPFVLTAPGSHIDFVPSVQNAWEFGVPRDQLPFCEDNGNYFCINANGKISYWDHNGPTDETWPNLATWIKEVWLEE